MYLHIVNLIYFDFILYLREGLSIINVKMHQINVRNASGYIIEISKIKF